MIFGCKSAQERFREEFEFIENAKYFPRDEKDRYEWERFKKQFEHGKADIFGDWHFHRFVLDKWYEWCDGIREKEREIEEKQREEARENLIKTHSYKGDKCRCRVCGEEKPIDQFEQLYSSNVYGEYGNGKMVSAEVLDGTGECKICWQKGLEEATEWMREYKRKWYQDHKEEIAAKQKANRPARRVANQKYAKTHRDHINQHIAERKQNDPVYKLKCQARKTIYSSFTRAGYVKQEKCESIVGLKQDAFIEYLLKTYEKNYGKSWDGEEPVHVDHIIPLATANTEEDVIRLCHYTNLQLLTAKDNILKGDKLYANC